VVTFLELTLANACIVLLVLVFLGWNLPPEALLKRITNRLAVPIVWLGLAHNWRMFAPTPVSGTQVVFFELSLSDGGMIELPVLDILGRPGRAANNRQLRLQHTLVTPGPSAFKAILCRYVVAEYARRCSDAEAQPLVAEVRVACLRQAAARIGSTRIPAAARTVVYRYRPANPAHPPRSVGA
jgi:hypothetical protein